MKLSDDVRIKYFALLHPISEFRLWRRTSLPALKQQASTQLKQLPSLSSRLLDKWGRKNFYFSQDIAHFYMGGTSSWEPLDYADSKQVNILGEDEDGYLFVFSFYDDEGVSRWEPFCWWKPKHWGAANSSKQTHLQMFLETV